MAIFKFANFQLPEGIVIPIKSHEKPSFSHGFPYETSISLWFSRGFPVRLPVTSTTVDGAGEGLGSCRIDVRLYGGGRDGWTVQLAGTSRVSWSQAAAGVT